MNFWAIVAVRKEELSRTLQTRLLTSTHGLMSEYFAKDCCMSLVEFMTNLKYRPKSVPRAWNMATLFMWGLTLFISALIPLSGLLFGCFLLSVISCVLVSYFGTKNLLIYEFCFRKRLFYNPLKFLDLNYDAFRSLILLAGVIILEIGVYLIH